MTQPDENPFAGMPNLSDEEIARLVKVNADAAIRDALERAERFSPIFRAILEAMAFETFPTEAELE